MYIKPSLTINTVNQSSYQGASISSIVFFDMMFTHLALKCIQNYHLVIIFFSNHETLKSSVTLIISTSGENLGKTNETQYHT